MFRCPGWCGTPISHTSCIQRVQAPQRGGDRGTRGAAQRPLPPAGGTSAARRTREHGAAAGELRVAGARPGPTGSQRGDACVAVGGQPPAPCPGAARDPAGWASLSGCSRQASRRTGRDRHGQGGDIASFAVPGPGLLPYCRAGAGLGHHRGSGDSRFRSAGSRPREQGSPKGLHTASFLRPPPPGLGFEL